MTSSEFSADGQSKVDDAPCIPYVSGSACSRLLSEFHILSEIGRGAFGDVIKVLYVVMFFYVFSFLCVNKSACCRRGLVLFYRKVKSDIKYWDIVWREVSDFIRWWVGVAVTALGSSVMSSCLLIGKIH